MGLTSLKASMGGAFANDNGGENAINQLTDIFVPAAKAADDAMASTTTADFVIWTNPFDFNVVVVAGRYTPANTITGDNTNNAVITAKTNDGGVATPAAALSMTTDVATGNFAANQPKAFTTLTPANAVIPPGGNLWLGIAKGGSGVIVRNGIFNFRLRRAS
jgi:hypothetical protein